MEQEVKKPWQPVWLPVLVILAVGVTVAVTMAPSELQKGSLSGSQNFAKKQPLRTGENSTSGELSTLSTRADLLSTISTPCSTAPAWQAFEQCQAFDISYQTSETKAVEVDHLEFFINESAVLYTIFPGVPNQKVAIQKTGRSCQNGLCISAYAFRVITPEGLAITSVRFVPKGEQERVPMEADSPPAEYGVLTVRLKQ